MSKKVQIDLELFMKLVTYICMEQQDEETKKYLQTKLEDKLTRLVSHQNYSEYLKHREDAIIQQPTEFE